MSEKSMRQQFVDTLLNVGVADPDLVVLVGDISHFALQPFSAACPGRYYNIGICEPTIVSMAAGLSKMGFYPVAHTIAPFLIERAFEQIKLDFCYQQFGGTLVTVGSAFDYSNLGCTHHCYGDFALLKTLQNTEIIYPASPVEFDVLFRKTYQNNRLTLFRLPGRQHGQTFGAADIRVGKGIKIRDGKDLTIIATGPQLRNAVDALEELDLRGLNAEVLYIHTIRPLDSELVRESVKKTRRVLVIEEHMRSGGLGDDVLRATADLGDVRYSFISIPDRFVTGYGSYQEHCESLGFTREGIIRKVLNDFRVDTLKYQNEEVHI